MMITAIELYGFMLDQVSGLHLLLHLTDEFKDLCVFLLTAHFRLKIVFLIFQSLHDGYGLDHRHNALV